ncbi:efflux RND transporter periplasmic adaptor subunit [Desulfoplanes formicivorans]|uniref:CusB-like beta-barrel domain-containing protein n=1 Tax=Desulfoplanes formicivorans TaxID=1592317 RepID=A0A194AGD8_9BACT|nr:efflux RND transporter periplasmic adaptor subunit [Desulfoplanes formicivorans]GAU08275.1 hypothetical protein DPF_0978 [Desulfoplanes formicivorans]
MHMLRSFPGLKTILFLPAVLVLLAGCRDPQPPASPAIRPVRAVKARLFSRTDTFVFSGTTKAWRSAELSFRIPGELLQLPVEVGSFLQTGDLVARLDPRDYATRVRALESQWAGARAALTEAELRFVRYKKLRASGSIAVSALDTAEAAYKGAQATVKALANSLTKARDDLADTRLDAPFSGYITRKYKDNFETVSAGMPIVTLQDFSRMEVVVGIPDTIMAKGGVDTGIQCTVSAFPDHVFAARIKELARDADPITRTFKLTVIFDKPDDLAITPGMTAEVHLHAINQRPGTVMVPETALFPRGKGSRVWVINGTTHTVSSRPVTIASLNAEGAVLFGDLEPGELVVTAGTNSLSEGQKVRILDHGPGHRGAS